MYQHRADAFDNMLVTCSEQSLGMVLCMLRQNMKGMSMYVVFTVPRLSGRMWAPPKKPKRSGAREKDVPLLSDIVSGPYSSVQVSSVDRPTVLGTEVQIPHIECGGASGTAL
jgi:hypothetical protein